MHESSNGKWVWDDRPLVRRIRGASRLNSIEREFSVVDFCLLSFADAFPENVAALAWLISEADSTKTIFCGVCAFLLFIALVLCPVA